MTTPSTGPRPKNIEACHQLIELLLAENRQLQIRVDWLARKLFGRSSERQAQGEIEFFGQAVDPAHLETNNGAPPVLDIESGEVAVVAQEADPAKAKRPGGGRRPLPADPPRRRLVYDVPAEAKVRGECGGEKKLIGEEVTEQIEYVPASMLVIEHVQLKYACPVCHERKQERRMLAEGAVREMREDPSKPACRSRLQTTVSCVG